LAPFFGEMKFSDMNSVIFDKFYCWARQRKYRGFEISNASLNKCMFVLKMVCKSAATEYRWGNGFNPFQDYKKLPELDPYEKIHPFTIEEQQELIAFLPDHWKPYFKFAFCSGLRPGEQIGLKLGDIDWENKVLHIRRAMTFDDNGKPIEGMTKNKYSRRSIKLLPIMMEALEEQKKIYKQFNCEYFFCTPKGNRIHLSNLRRRIWIPALEKGGIEIREMKQTRHSFATNTLGCGENPLWIARVLGHRDVNMIIKVYSRYVERSHGSEDGCVFNRLYQVN